MIHKYSTIVILAFYIFLTAPLVAQAKGIILTYKDGSTVTLKSYIERDSGYCFRKFGGEICISKKDLSSAKEITDNNNNVKFLGQDISSHSSHSSSSSTHDSTSSNDTYCSTPPQLETVPDLNIDTNMANKSIGGIYKANMELAASKARRNAVINRNNKTTREWKQKCSDEQPKTTKTSTRKKKPRTIQCLDGSYVYGTKCYQALDGTFVGDKPQQALDGSFVGGKPRQAPDGSFVGGGSRTTVLCPDGKYVSGSQCILTPNGTYIGK
ncbi:hypothetical protein LCGC14_1726160 [marine sediment metagenome]|uniref:Uncharacterized protein n=1 Tax=marine sediment metagenome TaxID=412755 RepID=A0A0F9KAP1_9ZZZZ